MDIGIWEPLGQTFWITHRWGQTICAMHWQCIVASEIKTLTHTQICSTTVRNWAQHAMTTHNIPTSERLMWKTVKKRNYTYYGESTHLTWIWTIPCWWNDIRYRMGCHLQNKHCTNNQQVDHFVTYMKLRWHILWLSHKISQTSLKIKDAKHGNYYFVDALFCE